MILSTADSHRFYQIWWPLLRFVNSRCNIIETFPENPAIVGLDIQDASKLRNILWNSPDLLDDFIQTNPAALAENELELAASWRHRLSGQFIILRHLKKYSVFLRDEESPIAFGVLGIMSPLHDVVGHYLPVMVNVALLPFEGKIIYDGLISPYQVSFGPSLRNRFNQAYRTAQELYGVQTVLNQFGILEANTNSVAKGNQKILLAFRKDLATAGLSEKTFEDHFQTVEKFVKTYLLQTTPPTSLLNIQPDHIAGFMQQQGKKANRVSFKRLARFLFTSERISPESFKALEAFLKSL